MPASTQLLPHYWQKTLTTRLLLPLATLASLSMFPVSPQTSSIQKPWPSWPRGSTLILLWWVLKHPLLLESLTHCVKWVSLSSVPTRQQRLWKVQKLLPSASWMRPGFLPDVQSRFQHCSMPKQHWMTTALPTSSKLMASLLVRAFW